MKIEVNETESAADLKSRVDRCYSARDTNELKNVYDDWAALYEADLVAELGWDGPQQTGEFLTKHCQPDQRVLDVGAGTGLGGVYLKNQNFTNIDALDMSENMLAEARKKAVYRNFHIARLGDKIDIPDDDFDALVITGVFTEAHAGPEALDELVRITRPGGVLVFSMRPDVERDMGFRTKMDELENAGRWEHVETSPFLQGFRDVQTSPYRIFVYRAK